jgi:hypothetical protein
VSEGVNIFRGAVYRSDGLWTIPGDWFELQIRRIVQHHPTPPSDPDPGRAIHRELSTTNSKTRLVGLRRQHDDHAQLGLSLRPCHVEDHSGR